MGGQARNSAPVNEIRPTSPILDGRPMTRCTSMCDDTRPHDPDGGGGHVCARTTFEQVAESPRGSCAWSAATCARRARWDTLPEQADARLLAPR